MHGLMDRFFELFLSFVHRYEGRINQFLGDGFMALFESRAAREDHEERAALAASEIRSRFAEMGIAELNRINREDGASGEETLAVRTGLRTTYIIVW